MSLNPEHERWAEVLQIEKVHGDSAPYYIAEQIGRLATRGDLAGIGRWQEIAVRFDALQSWAGPLS